VDLGLAGYLVGRTGFCVHPAETVSKIPKVGGTKSVNLEKIRRLAPTHVFLNVDENTLETKEDLVQFVPHIIVTHPQTPKDNLCLIDQVIASFDPGSIAFDVLSSRAEHLKQQFLVELQQLGQPRRLQSVLYLIWREPWITVARDTYISRMLALIGWQTWPNVLGGDKGAARYPEVNTDAPGLRSVERVLLSSEPYRFDQSHVREVQNWLPFAKVQCVDGEMLSWYGSRSVKGLAYLGGLLREEESASASPS